LWYIFIVKKILEIRQSTFLPQARSAKVQERRQHETLSEIGHKETARPVWIERKGF